MSSKSECISIPKGNEKLPHEKLLEYVENNNPTEREIFDNFPLDREVLESVMDYQLKVSKSIEKYSEDGEERYKLTKKGFGMLYFSDGPVVRISTNS